MPLDTWVEVVQQPGFTVLDTGQTPDVYWAVLGNELGFLQVAFEPRTAKAQGQNAVVQVLPASDPPARLPPTPATRSTSLKPATWGAIREPPTRPWQQKPGTQVNIPVGTIERVPPDAASPLRVLVVLDGYKTLVDTTIPWPPAKP